LLCTISAKHHTSGQNTGARERSDPNTTRADRTGAPASVASGRRFFSAR